MGRGKVFTVAETILLGSAKPVLEDGLMNKPLGSLECRREVQACTKHKKVTKDFICCARTEEGGSAHGLLTPYFNLNHNRKLDMKLIYQMSAD